MITLEITANTVAWYGAIVATIGLLISGGNLILNYLKEKRRIEVKTWPGFHTIGGSVSEMCIFIEARNKGHRPVTLNSAGLELSDGSNMFFPSMSGIPLPHELQEGKNYISYLDKQQIVQSLKEIGVTVVSAWYTTATGETYKTYKNIENLKLS